jgi:hypothetical protein
MFHACLFGDRVWQPGGARDDAGPKLYRENYSMRAAFLAVLAAALSFTAAVPAQAVGIRHAFCLQGQEYPGLSYCTYDSYAQCQATASGRQLQCIANPYFAGVSDDPRATPYPYSQRQRVRPRPPTPNLYAPFPNLFEFQED